MANSINSISTGTGGLQSIADGTSGNLLIQKDAGTIATFSATGVVVSGVVAATTLTGDGSALTGISSGGLTLLATANTTSGTSVSSGTLDLSGYKQVWTDMYSVGPAVNGGFLQFQPNGGTATYYVDGTVSTTQAFYGTIIHDLTSGNWFANPTTTQGGRNDTARVGNGAASNQGVNTGLTTSTTSITWSWTNGVAFNAGIIRIYGLK
jgi:hypothetical protein